MQTKASLVMSLNSQGRMNTMIVLKQVKLHKAANCLLERWSLMTFVEQAMLKNCKSHNGMVC